MTTTATTPGGRPQTRVHAAAGPAPHARVPRSSTPAGSGTFCRCTVRLHRADLGRPLHRARVATSGERCTLGAVDGGDRCRLHTLRLPA